MAKKKTSAETAREQSEIAKVEGMLGDAFGSLGGLEQPVQEEMSQDTTELVEEDTDVKPFWVETGEEAESAVVTNEEDVLETAALETPAEVEPVAPPSEELSKPPAPPSGPPGGPPSGPPAPPSGPPNPPSRPPSKTPSPPSGPPGGPLSGPPAPPSGPPAKPPSVTEEQEEVQPTEMPLETDSAETADEPIDSQPEIKEVNESEKTEEIATQKAPDADIAVANEEVSPIEETEEVPEITEDAETQIGDSSVSQNEEESEEDIIAKEAEIARLSAEVERLRSSISGAADIIEEMENPPMPPMIQDDLVIGAHIVADIARMARQLDREELIKASMGTIAMLHPERLDVLISTKHSALLPRMNEQDICAGKLNSDPPRSAPNDWRVLEVLLASTSIITGGPAAVIHCHSPYSTAVSCEKDLVLMQPIDEIGKEHIGKVIIVDPDDENPREYLRQVAEALKQGGMRCVVIRGNGAYAVGADLDQAWANAAMLEHSMKIIMLARQANLKI